MSPRWAAIASALLFSTGGAAIKATTLNPWQVSGLRSAVAAIFIALILPEARRQWSWRTALVALAYAACLTSFVLATKNTTSANAIFLQSTAPLYLVLLGPWLLGERAGWAELATLGLIAGGMALVFWGSMAPDALAPNPEWGNALGAFSGVMWAGTICGLRWLGKRGEGNAMAPVLLGNCFAVLFCLAPMLPISQIGWADLAALAYLGVFQIGLAYWCLTRAVAGLTALEASLLVLVEPALNPVWTWCLHGERPSGLAIAGGAMILAAALGRSLHERQSVVN